MQRDTIDAQQVELMDTKMGSAARGHDESWAPTLSGT
jgi:hypothetical protein